MSPREDENQIYINVNRSEAMTAKGVRKALVSIGGGKTALFESQAEPPKPPRPKLDQTRLPVDWKRRRERLLARAFGK